jgi:hypothetical protein
LFFHSAAQVFGAHVRAPNVDLSLRQRLASDWH